jgi:hypothetical protein
MASARMAEKQYLETCKQSAMDPSACILDALARDAEALSVRCLSPTEVEALACVLPDSSIRTLKVCQTHLTCSSWALLAKACSCLHWKTLALQDCDLAQLDQKSLGVQCGSLRTEQLGAGCIRGLCALLYVDGPECMLASCAATAWRRASLAMACHACAQT